MAPRGAARFCASCQKHVHDLGAMTALEVRALLSRGGACVRATVDRAGRIVVAPAAFGLLAGSSAVAPGDSPAACAPWWDRLADAAVIWWNGPADVPSFGTNEVTDEVVQLLTQLGYANSDDRDVATWMRLVEGHPAQRARLTCEDGVRVVPLPPGVGVAVPPGCGPQNLGVLSCARISGTLRCDIAVVRSEDGTALAGAQCPEQGIEAVFSSDRPGLLTLPSSCDVVVRGAAGTAVVRAGPGDTIRCRTDQGHLDCEVAGPELPRVDRD